MDTKQQKDLELTTAIIKTYIMGLYIERFPNNVVFGLLSGTYYVSVPKNGVKTVLGEPAVYGEELAKRFEYALKNYGVDCVVKCKIRNEYWYEYWSADDVKIIKETLSKSVQEAFKNLIRVNSGYNSL